MDAQPRKGAKVTVRELFEVWKPSERVIVENGVLDELFRGYVAVFPQQYLDSEVERVGSHLEFFKKDYDGEGAKRQLEEKDAAKISFRDAEYKLFHRIMIKKLVLNTAEVPQKDPRAYDWGLRNKEREGRFEEYVPESII